MYDTEAVYLPLAPLVIQALKSDGAVEALDACGLVHRVLVEEPVSNTLFIASLVCDKMCNEHAPLQSQKHPLLELENCVGEDKRFKWVVLQKSKDTKWGIDSSPSVKIPKVKK